MKKISGIEEHLLVLYTGHLGGPVYKEMRYVFETFIARNFSTFFEYQSNQFESNISYILELNQLESIDIIRHDIRNIIRLNGRNKSSNI